MNQNNNTGKRIRIIVLWVIFLVVTSFIIYHVENSIHFRNAKKELSEQAVTVAGQIPSIVENDLCTQVGWEMLFAKLQALSCVLEAYDDIDDAREFLDDYVQAADIRGLTIYDRNAQIIYNSADSLMLDLKAEDICNILDTRMYEQNAQGTTYTYTDEIGSLVFSSISLAEIEQNYYWGVKDQWFILISNSMSDDWKNIESYFKWNNVLSNIRIGNTGSVLAVDENDGTVLSCVESDKNGKPVSELDIRINDDGRACSLEDLLAVFDQPGQVEEIRIADSSFYAVRLDINHVLMLALLPFDEIREQVKSETGLLAFLIILITGFYVLYAFFHVDGRQHVLSEGKGRFVWDKTLLNGLIVAGVLAVSGVLIIGMYLEYLSDSARTFQYNSRKVESIVELMYRNGNSLEELQEWSENEYKSKCSIVKCIVEHTAEKKITREYLDRLSDSLHIQSISVFDPNGKLVSTNSQYDRITIDENSAFYELLMGEPYAYEIPAQQSEEFILKTGMSLRDETGASNGMVLITADSKELGVITKNLGLAFVLRQIWLSDGTVVMAVSDCDSGRMIDYITEVQNGKRAAGIDLSGYAGLSLSDIGIDEEKLQDNYNGSIQTLQERYFASIRRAGDYYYLVMKPQTALDITNMIPVLISAAAVLAFTILLILVLCLTGKKMEGANEENASEPELNKEEPGGYLQRDDDFFAMFGNLMNKNKPYFEERWPRDCVKWKDKSADDKFKSAARVLLLAAFVAMFVQAVLTGETSVWYYCLTGKWDSGINLNSITSCILSLCVLIVVKTFLHKLLYLIARAVSAKGETICHLLDSFSGYMLFIAWIFICLSYFGVNATALSLTGGVAGVIFGIGCQNIVADILSGILMTFEGVVHVGDLVSYNDRLGVVLSIGVRTTKLLWFGDITIVRNNDFKNYIKRPSDKETRLVVDLNIDLKESLENIERILETELPQIHESLCSLIGEEVRGPVYRGVQKIGENFVVLSFGVFCKGKYYSSLSRAINRELKLMCERNDIAIAMPQIVVNKPKDEPIQNRTNDKN